MSFLCSYNATRVNISTFVPYSLVKGVAASFMWLLEDTLAQCATKYGTDKGSLRTQESVVDDNGRQTKPISHRAFRASIVYWCTFFALV